MACCGSLSAALWRGTSRCVDVVLTSSLTQQSLFASPRLLKEFGPHIAALPSDIRTQLASGCSLDALQHEHTTLCAERLDLCYFLLRRDQANKVRCGVTLHL